MHSFRIFSEQGFCILVRRYCSSLSREGAHISTCYPVYPEAAHFNRIWVDHVFTYRGSHWHRESAELHLTARRVSLSSIRWCICLLWSKWNSWRYALQIEDIKNNKSEKKISCLGSVKKDVWKCDTDIWKCTEVAKDAFRKPKKVLRNRKILLKTNKVQKCYVIAIISIWQWMLNDFLTDEWAT